MEKRTRAFTLGIALGLTSFLFAHTPVQAPPVAESGHLLFARLADLKWEKFFPEWGEGSPEFAVIRENPGTHLTHVMVRAPKNFHMPSHWHTAAETTVVIIGALILEWEGNQQEFHPGDFTYIPGNLIHEWRTKSTEGVLFFASLEGQPDIQWKDGPPSPPQAGSAPAWSVIPSLP